MVTKLSVSILSSVIQVLEGTVSGGEQPKRLSNCCDDQADASHFCSAIFLSPFASTGDSISCLQKQESAKKNCKCVFQL